MFYRFANILSFRYKGPRSVWITDLVLQRLSIYLLNGHQFVQVGAMCGGTGVCSNERRMCEGSRTSAVFTKASSQRALEYSLLYCLRGLSTIQQLAEECAQEKFVYPESGQIFGASSETGTMTMKMFFPYHLQLIYSKAIAK